MEATSSFYMPLGAQIHHSLWLRTAPCPIYDASVSKTKGVEGSATFKMVACASAFFTALKASSQSDSHLTRSEQDFLVSENGYKATIISDETQKYPDILLIVSGVGYIEK